MNALNTALLINLLGFTVGVALYALLLAMVISHRRAKEIFSFDFLLAATAILGFLWNVGELVLLIWEDFGARNASPFLQAISYSALGFLPSVVVHSAWKNADGANKNARLLTFAAYGLSFLAAFFHFHSSIFYNVAPSNLALQILTVGSLALIVGLLVFNFKNKLENKRIWIAALLIFAVSALHLSSNAEDNSWLVELVAHQSSLPLALAILLQDYRFAFADLFLKRALSLLLLALTAFGLYVFVAAPIFALHATHEKNDVQAVSVLLTFWIATALSYPAIHRFAVWLVDKIILRRADYETLRQKISSIVENQPTIEKVLSETCRELASALTANDFGWTNVSQKESNLPTINFTSEQAEIFISPVESPFYKIRLENFSGGRRLLSDEIKMLEEVALLTARRIDVLRVSDERFEQKTREQEFSKLATEAELRALRAQINPHFLFNALTTIGYLIQTAPEKAFATLMKLTALLRRVLKSSGEFSTLGEEIELVEAYLEIERARFEERLQVEIEVAQDLRKMRVPTLILQPLIENAIKHGVSKTRLGGIVKISAKLENEAAKVFLKINVFDSGAGLNADEILQNRQKGVGLNNIEQRLDSYYGDAASLKIEGATEKGTTAEIKIPISNAKILK